MRLLRSLSRASFVLSLLGPLAGCQKAPPPAPQPDGGDGGPIIGYTDSDGDGLCDATELARGTNPYASDTDGDGFSDRVEIEFGFNPTRTDSPDRDIVVYVDEVAGRARVPIAHVVRGEGQSYTGAFQALPVSDPDGLDAASFYAGSSAFGADPPENVFQIVPEDERFAGVIGRTELVFEAFFEVRPIPPPRGCLRAYPWRYNIKREDGTLLLARRYLLVLKPEDEGAGWCPRQGVCL